jgi:hypothetical protein
VRSRIVGPSHAANDPLWARKQRVERSPLSDGLGKSRASVAHSPELRSEWLTVRVAAPWREFLEREPHRFLDHHWPGNIVLQSCKLFNKHSPSRLRVTWKSWRTRHVSPRN